MLAKYCQLRLSTKPFSSLGALGMKHYHWPLLYNLIGIQTKIQWKHFTLFCSKSSSANIKLQWNIFKKGFYWVAAPLHLELVEYCVMGYGAIFSGNFAETLFLSVLKIKQRSFWQTQFRHRKSLLSTVGWARLSLFMDCPTLWLL